MTEHNAGINTKIKKIAQALKATSPGSVVHVLVKHDDDCPALITQSLADCTCDPDVETRPATGPN